jgi:N-acylneuraminate cytidylyltransferase
MRLRVIPARGGSKRIPRKNIKEFFGQPIISYSIKVAIASNCFDRSIVSTDDAEISEVAKSFGAEVPFHRSQELSDDYAGIMPVIKHAIEWFDNHEQSPTEVCCIFATAPFVQVDALRNAYEQMRHENADYCFSLTSFAFPIQRAIKLTPEKRINMFYPDYFEKRSQDLVEAYHDAGQFYWGKAEAFRLQQPLFSSAASPYILPRHLVQDIDSKEDWKRAELMFQVLKHSGELV